MGFGQDGTWPLNLVSAVPEEVCFCKGVTSTPTRHSGKFVNCYNIKRQARFKLPGSDSSVEFWSHSLHKPSGASLWHFVIYSQSQVELEPITHRCPPLFSMDSVIPHLSSHSLAIHQPFQFGDHLPKCMFLFGDYHYKLMFYIFKLVRHFPEHIYCLFSLSLNITCLKLKKDQHILPQLFLPPFIKNSGNRQIMCSNPFRFSRKSIPN